MCDRCSSGKSSIKIDPDQAMALKSTYSLDDRAMNLDMPMRTEEEAYRFLQNTPSELPNASLIAGRTIVIPPQSPIESTQQFSYFIVKDPAPPLMTPPAPLPFASKVSACMQPSGMRHERDHYKQWT